MSAPPRHLRSFPLRAVESRFFVPACLACGLALRLAWVFLVDARPVSDFAWYYDRGVEFAEGWGYSVHGIPTAYWPVGYPAFLGILFALFGPSLLAAKMANVALYAGAMLLAWQVARRLFRSELTGRLTLLLLAFFPNQIAYCSLVSAETLFVFLAMGAMALLLVERRSVACLLAAGGVFGLATLVKPQAVLLPAVFYGTGLAAKLRAKALRGHLAQAAAVHAIMIAALVPWTIRNYVLFGGFVPVANNSGINLYIGNNPEASGKYNLGENYHDMLRGITDERERNVAARRAALAYILGHPIETIGLWPEKLRNLYEEDRDGLYWNAKGLDRVTRSTARLFQSLSRVANGYYAVVGAACVLSLFVLLLRRKADPFPALGLWIVLCFTSIYVVTFGKSRFHFPMIPWIAMYAAALGAMLLRRLAGLASSAPE